MPVYVYRNLRTGETFEVEQRITESAWTEHPDSGDPVKRLVQPVGIAFKGSGFYVTDSRGASKSGASPAAGGDAGAAKSDGAGGSKGDAASVGAKDGVKKASSGGTSDGGGAAKSAPASKASA